MAEIIDLHEYFTCCPECDGMAWYIQWNTQQTEVIQLICANPDCTAVFENPAFNNGDIYFEPEFEL